MDSDSFLVDEIDPAYFPQLDAIAAMHLDPYDSDFNFNDADLQRLDEFVEKEYLRQANLKQSDVTAPLKGEGKIDVKTPRQCFLVLYPPILSLSTAVG